MNRQVISYESVHRQAVLAANGGSLFGLKFLPTNLLQFARPDALTVTRTFPWIFFPGKALVLGHLLYDTRDWTSSVPASMPVLFLLAVVGARRGVTARPQSVSTPRVAGDCRRQRPGSCTGHCGFPSGRSGRRDGRHPDHRFHRRALPGRRHAAPAAGRFGRLALRGGPLAPSPGGAERVVAGRPPGRARGVRTVDHVLP